MEGGPAQKEAANSQAPNWSPDGNSLVVTSTVAGKHLGEKRWSELNTIDLRSGKSTMVTNSQGTLGGFWVTQEILVAALDGLDGFSLFDFRTQKWTKLISGWFVNWFPSADGKYLYCVTGGLEPKAIRVRFGDHHAETVASLNAFRRVVDVYTGLYLGASPDGSVLITRDIGTQEIYALSVRFP
jgi:WD40-like Beta Propeller Repeat